VSGSETIDIREAHRFEEARLTRYLHDHLPGFAGPVCYSQFAGGQSNPTYLIESAAASHVLRRKPPGVTLASAHAVDREFRVISALSQAGFPVPRPVVLCEDTAVIGTPFYVMERVHGRVLWDPALVELPQPMRRKHHEALIDTLARLHALDAAAIGLGDYGKPGNYFARQIARWTRQYQSDPEAGRLKGMDALADWLPQNIPSGDETSVVHGDYRLDNVMFAPKAPSVIAVIDWELSTLGHPLADFTNLLLMYKFPHSLMKSLSGLDAKALGVPDEDEAVAIYCQAAKRKPLQDRDFYHAYNLFRFAAICHGIRGRMLRGNASSAQAERYATSVEPLTDLAVMHARRSGMTA
jgi:aminoglycoside phosphotransferase (APT) family kinase protein